MKRQRFSVVTPQFTTSSTPAVGVDFEEVEGSDSECELHSTALDSVARAPLVSDGIGVGDDEFVNKRLRQLRRDEGWLGNDGVAERRQSSRYNEAYLRKLEEVDRALANDRVYQFIQLVAGFTNQPVERLFDRTALELETERFVSAEQRRVQNERDSAGALQRLANEIASIDERISETERSYDALADAQARLCEALAEYATNSEKAQTEFDKADYLRNVATGQIVAHLISGQFGAFPRRLFDLLSRWAIMAYGDWQTAFSQNFFTEKLETIVDIAAELVEQQDSNFPNVNVAQNKPATSRLAFYIAALHAIVTANLHTKPLPSSAFAADSAYAAQPSAYSDALRRLHEALLRAGGDGLNYLDYDRMTLALYAVLVDMHAASGTALPRPARPQPPAPPGDRPSRGQGRSRRLGDVEVILEIPDEDLLRAIETGAAEEDDTGLFTPEQLRETRNKPYESLTLSKDVVALLLDLLRPAVTGYMPQMLYRPPTLQRDTLETQAGGFTDETRLLFAWATTATTNDDDDDNDVDDKPVRISRRAPSPRRSKRQTRSRFRRLAAHADNAQLNAQQQMLTIDYGNLAGVLVLAIGIYHHALHRNTTNVSIEHLLAEGVPFVGQIAEAAERALIVELQAQAPAYIDFLRRELQRRFLLSPAARSIRALQAAAENVERIEGTEQFFDYANQTRAALTALSALNMENERTVEDALEALQNRLAGVGASTERDEQAVLATASMLVPLQMYAELCGEAAQRSAIGRRLALLTQRLSTLRSNQAKLTDARQSRIMESDEDRIRRAASSARETAVVDPAVAMSFRNTGIFRISPLLMSAIAQSIETVRNWVPSLANATAEFMETDESLRTLFARLVACNMNQATILHPTQYRTEGSMNLSLREQVSIINDMRIRVGDTTPLQATMPQTVTLTANPALRMVPTALRPVMRLPFGEHTFR